MRVGILVPFYQVEPFIERCARSVLEQTYSDIDYLFIDDYSTDRSLTILKQTLEDYPTRKDSVRIIQNSSNLGLACCRNIAVEACPDPFLFWVDADDWITPDAIAQLVALQKQSDADIVTGRTMLVEDDKMREVSFSSRSSKEDTLVGLLDLSIDHPVWGRLIRTALYKDNGIQCKEGVNYREDFQVTPKLFYYAKRVSDLDTVIYYYNQNNPLSYLALAKQDERVMLKKRL